MHKDDAVFALKVAIRDPEDNGVLLSVDEALAILEALDERPFAQTMTVPVQVTLHTVPGNALPAPDSAQVAETLHQRLTLGEAQFVNGWELLAVDGLAADPDDPDSPPVPATVHPDEQPTKAEAEPDRPVYL